MFDSKEKELKENKSAYFPLFIDLKDKQIVVVGAGKIGTRRIQTLAQFPCQIRVIAEHVSKPVQELQTIGRLEVVQKKVEKQDLEGAFLILAATDSKEVNDWIIKTCNQTCFVNHAGDKEQSNFYFPGIIKEENYVIGVSASGVDHKGAKKLTESIKRWVKMEKVR